MGGFATVVSPAWIPTFQRYADVNVAGGTTYTPASGGIFVGLASAYYFSMEFYSTALAGWESWPLYLYSYGNGYPIGIGDGVNMRFRNGSTTAYQLVLMRMG
jgi:hypothetical protein